jgi:hypothetical protein
MIIQRPLLRYEEEAINLVWIEDVWREVPMLTYSRDRNQIHSPGISNWPCKINSDLHILRKILT